MKIGKEAKDLIKEGVNKVNNAVSATMGGCGALGLIEHPQGVFSPHSSKDGLTVLDNSFGDCQYSELGAQLLKEASKKTVFEVGDGSTSTCVTASALINKSFEDLDNVSHVEINNGIKKAKEQALKQLNKLKKEVTDKEAVQIATVSANNNSELGKLVADIYKKVGTDSTIEVKLGSSEDTTVNYVEGVRLNRGYSLSYFVTDFTKNTCELENARVLIYNGAIKNVKDIHAQVTESLQSKSPLLVMCEDMDETVMTALVKLKMEGTLQVCVMMMPEFGQNRENVLSDLAISIGATVYNPKFQSEIKMGYAEKIISSKDVTVILPTTEYNKVDERVQLLKSQLENADKLEKTLLERRIANLKSAVVEINVGGSSEVDAKERKDLIDDSVGALRSALLGGFVAGGGSTMSHIANKLKNNCKGGEYVGFEAFREALRAPYRQILENAGLNSEDYPITKYGRGVNVLKRKEVNLLKEGIIDSAKVVNSVIENATSVAITAISTNILILTR